MISVTEGLLIETYTYIISSLLFSFLAFLVYFRRLNRTVKLFRKTVSLIDFIIYLSLIRTVSSEVFREKLAEMTVASSLDLGSPKDFERAVRKSLSSNATLLKLLRKSFALRKKLTYSFKVFRESLRQGLTVSGLALFLALTYGIVIHFDVVIAQSPVTYMLLGALVGFSIVSVQLLYKTAKTYVDLRSVKRDVMMLYEGLRLQGVSALKADRSKRT